VNIDKENLRQNFESVNREHWCKLYYSIIVFCKGQYDLLWTFEINIYQGRKPRSVMVHMVIKIIGEYIINIFFMHSMHINEVIF
jgi:hypothetical protein